MKRIQEFALRGSSQRGAAKVGIVWLICVIFLLLFAVLFAFTGNSENADLRKSLETAQKERADAVAKEEATTKKIGVISRAVGFYDRESSFPVTDVDAVKKAIENAKQVFSDAGASATDLDLLLPVTAQSYQARTREIQQLKDQVATVTSEKATMEASLRQASTEKTAQIAAVQKQLDDAVQAASRAQSGLEAQIAALKNTNGDLEKGLKTARGETEVEKRNLANATIEFQTRVTSMSHKLAFLKEPESPDGSLLAVAKDAKMGWIDIGANQRVAAGMKFAVISGKLGSTAVKCVAEVSKTEPGRAEVTFTQVLDQFDPPVVGDRIFNPLLDPKGERNAVLVGRFSLPTENEVRVLLKNLGITVQAKLDNTTDYLVVGGEMYVDQEGNALEEPMQPSETAVYKEAEAKGVAITPLKDLRAYFKF